MEVIGSKIRRTIFFSLVLTTILVALAGAKTAYADAIIRAPNNLGLVGYWSFDEGRGTQASDLSGNGNDGTLTGGPTWTIGKSKSALEFDGVNDYVNVGDPSTSDWTNITTSVWVYWTGDGLNGYSGIYYKNSGSSRDLGRLLIRNDGKLLVQNGNGNFESEDSGDVVKNEWTHIAYVYDQSAGKEYLYINGTLKGQKNRTGNISQESNNLWIGFGYNQANNYMFQGKIDEVRIYSRALSETEIQSLYVETSSALVGRTPTEQYSDGLVAHYTFDGKHTSTTTVTDIVGGNDGTIHGAVPVPGVIGQAMGFDGVDDYITMGNQEDFYVGVGDLSYCYWLKTTDTSGQPVGKGVWNYNAWGSYLSGAGDVRFEMKLINPPGSGFNKGTLVVNDGIWHHVCGTYDRDDLLSVYTDGQLSNTQNMSTGDGYDMNNGAAFMMGDGPPGHFEGAIDDVRVYKKVLSPGEIVGIYTSTKPSSMTSSPNSLVTNGLVGHWTFDSETISGSTVSDVSGNGNNGTISGNPDQTTGKIGGALEFDGVSDYVDVGDIDYSSYDEIAVSMWVKTSINDHDHDLVLGNARNNTLNGFSLSNYVSGHWYFYHANLNNNIGAISEGGWSHIVLIIKENDKKVAYVNGIQKLNATSGDYDIDNGDVHTYIGAGGDIAGGTKLFEGIIDDVRIYNRALTESEVEQLYSMGQ